MVVGDEVNLAVACRLEEDFDGRLLAEADLEDKPAVGDEQIEGAGDEAAIDGQAIVSGEKRGVRLVVADLDGETLTFGCRNIGGIRRKDVEGLTCERGEQVAFEESDPVFEVIALRIFLCDG